MSRTALEIWRTFVFKARRKMAVLTAWCVLRRPTLRLFAQDSNSLSLGAAWFRIRKRRSVLNHIGTVHAICDVQHGRTCWRRDDRRDGAIDSSLDPKVDDGQLPKESFDRFGCRRHSRFNNRLVGTRRVQRLMLSYMTRIRSLYLMRRSSCGYRPRRTGMPRAPNNSFSRSRFTARQFGVKAS